MTGLLFFRPAGILGHLIATVSHHAPGVPDVAHVAVVTGQDSNTNWVVESWAPHGVRTRGYPRGAGIFVPIRMDTIRLHEEVDRLKGAGYDSAAG